MSHDEHFMNPIICRHKCLVTIVIAAVVSAVGFRLDSGINMAGGV